MINEEILGGLRAALEKGQTLRAAMMSFYNAGYKKEEIEEAARSLIDIKREAQKLQQMPEPEAKGKIKTSQLLRKKRVPMPKPGVQPQTPQQIPLAQRQLQQAPAAQITQPAKTMVVQKVSGYGEKKKLNTKIIILSIVLALLLGGLIILFLFKDIVIDFFSKINLFD